MSKLMLQIGHGPIVEIDSESSLKVMYEYTEAERDKNFKDEQLHLTFNDQGWVAEAVRDGGVVSERRMLSGEVFEKMIEEDAEGGPRLRWPG